jgi:steroid delta-isomerase-like uncharacterized protein
LLVSEKDNIRVAEENTKAMNAHDNVRIRSFHGEGYQFQSPAAPGPVDEAARDAYMEETWTAFPDLTFETVQTIAQGDYVVLNWICTGTHTGPMHLPTGETVPATGLKVTAPGSVTIELKDGRIVREHSYFDDMGIMAQLGLLPGA